MMTSSLTLKAFEEWLLFIGQSKLAAFVSPFEVLQEKANGFLEFIRQVRRQEGERKGETKVQEDGRSGLQEEEE